MVLNQNVLYALHYCGLKLSCGSHGGYVGIGLRWRHHVRIQYVAGMPNRR